MKIQIVSDLHLEHQDIDDSKYILPITSADVIVLAGDIGNGIAHKNWLLSQLKIHNKPIIYVLGNHEFYHHDIIKISAQWQKISNENENLYVLDNDSIVIDDVLFIGSTLWTSATTKTDIYHLEWGINDFKAIKIRNKRLSAKDTNLLHNYALEHIQLLEKTEIDKKVVITHHSPSFKSIARPFKNSPLNCAFATPLDNFIKGSSIDLWIHGHMHNRSDYFIGKTRIVTNPKGYPNEPKYSILEFDDKLTIEI